MTRTVSRASAWLFAVVLLAGASMPARAADEPATKPIAAAAVQVTRDDSVIEFCTALG
jgi:hypothetical protein